MSSSLHRIEAEAMKLAPAERADLADRLWCSVHTAEEVDSAWSTEIEHRIQQIDRGEAACLSWEQVMADMKAKFG